MNDDERALIEATKRACLEAALRASEEGGVAGLCMEGRLDLALDAIRSVREEDVAQKLGAG